MGDSQHIEHHVPQPIPTFTGWKDQKPDLLRRDTGAQRQTWLGRDGPGTWSLGPMLARKSTLFRDTGRSARLTGRGQDTDRPSFRVSDLLCSWTKRFAASLATPPEPPASPTRDRAPRSAIEAPIGRAFDVWRLHAELGPRDDGKALRRRPWARDAFRLSAGVVSTTSILAPRVCGAWECVVTTGRRPGDMSDGCGCRNATLDAQNPEGSWCGANPTSSPPLPDTNESQEGACCEITALGAFPLGGLFYEPHRGRGGLVRNRSWTDAAGVAECNSSGRWRSPLPVAEAPVACLRAMHCCAASERLPCCMLIDGH